MNKIRLIVSFICIIFVSGSCNHFQQENGITSGTLEYNITYLNNDISDKEASLLPKTMKLVFNKEESVNYIDGFLGLYKLNTLVNFTSRRCVTLLKVFDKQYAYHGKKDEFMCCFDAMEDMEIAEANDTRIIAGLQCKHAIVRLPSRNETFDIYYTNEIDLQHPNANNPYKHIDGVLMKFELQLLHLRMDFTADNFQPGDDNGSRLKVPNSAVDISRDQMTQILNKLLE